jgi:LacI family transcriptional regulator, galactose operon repressor
MAITLKNISEICKVDISTVSRALRNDLRVKAETREFIQEKAAKLGYTPNLAARNLVSGKTLNLWMIISELSNPVEQEPAQFLSKSLHSQGYELLITLYHADAKKFNHLLSQLSQHVADGAFIIPSLEYSAPAYMPLLQNDFPLVFIDRQPTFENCTTVTTANKTAAKELLQKCLDAGADYFIILAENENSVTRMRFKGAVEFLNENNLTFTQVNSEYAPPAEFLSKNIAVFSSSGTTSEQYAKTFLSKHRPPRLISASFDSAPANPALFDHVFVGMQNFEAIAESAANLMLEKINGKSKAQTIEVPLKKLVSVK